MSPFVKISLDYYIAQYPCAQVFFEHLSAFLRARPALFTPPRG
jgi:hypothetical protein